MGKRHWTETQLRDAVRKSKSIRQVLHLLELKEAGGNYSQIQKYLKEFNIETKHFTGKAWNKGLKGRHLPRIELSKILVFGSNFQSYKLKQRLFVCKLKEPKCEECGWARESIDGRIPLELDHINGDSKDNRLENLRVLCPNCHSLKPTHRGRNRKSDI